MCTVRSMAPSDPVNHPSHYTRTSLETIDVIEDMVKGWPSASAYRLGNVLKYVWRHRDKGDPKENLKKALWYLQRELDALAPAEGYAPVKPADALGPCTVPACLQPASVRVKTADGITQSCSECAKVPRCSAPGCLCLSLPRGGLVQRPVCYTHLWTGHGAKPVEVAKPLETRSVVVEPLPPEQHNNISAFSRVKHLGEVGTVMALGLEQAEVVFHNGQRRWVPIADLELA